MGKYQKNIEAARRISVMQYLETYHPGELVRKTDKEYCTKTHSSLVITPANGLFHWFSQSKGGNNALDYLVKVEGIHHEEKVDFIPSDIGLSDMEVSLVNVMAHEKIMEQALEPFKDKYDYCLIDCMPSLGIITVASLVAADRVLIPVQAQHFALKGLVSLFKSVNQVKRRINSRLDIDGIVLTMVDKRTNLSKDVCAALRSAYGHALKIYRAEIPVSTRTAESAASTHSVLTYDANGPASMAYKALAKEVTENERVRQQHQSALAR